MSINNKVITSNDLAAVLNEVLPPKEEEVESLTPSITTSTGTLKAALARKIGNVVVLQIQFTNANNVANGSNIYQGVLNDVSLRPILQVTSSSFLSGRVFGMVLQTDGTIQVRNTASAVTMGASSTCIGSFTYIVA